MCKIATANHGLVSHPWDWPCVHSASSSLSTSHFYTVWVSCSLELQSSTLNFFAVFFFSFFVFTTVWCGVAMARASNGQWKLRNICFFFRVILSCIAGSFDGCFPHCWTVRICFDFFFHILIAIIFPICYEWVLCNVGTFFRSTFASEEN